MGGLLGCVVAGDITHGHVLYITSPNDTTHILLGDSLYQMYVHWNRGLPWYQLCGTGYCCYDRSVATNDDIFGISAFSDYCLITVEEAREALVCIDRRMLATVIADVLANRHQAIRDRHADGTMIAVSYESYYVTDFCITVIKQCSREVGKPSGFFYIDGHRSSYHSVTPHLFVNTWGLHTLSLLFIMMWMTIICNKKLSGRNLCNSLLLAGVERGMMNRKQMTCTSENSQTWEKSLYGTWNRTKCVAHGNLY